MTDLDAVNLGLDENEADIAEELQDFEDSFDTRSEASSDHPPGDKQKREPSISSVSSKTSQNSSKKTSRSRLKHERQNDNKANGSKVRRIE